MSERTKPYLKIAGFCKQLIFSMGSYQGTIAGASLRRWKSRKPEEKMSIRKFRLAVFTSPQQKNNTFSVSLLKLEFWQHVGK